MGAPEVRARLSFRELPVAVRLHSPDLSAVVLGRRRVLHEIGERPLPVPAQRLGENEPPLRLREDAAVLLDARVVDDGERPVKSVRAVGRIHDHRAVRRVQPLPYAVQRFVRLFVGSRSADDRPRLRVQPHIGFRRISVPDYLAVFPEPTDEPVLVPAQSIQLLSELFLFPCQKSEILRVFPVLRKLLHDPQRVIELEGDKGGFPRFAQAQAVVPVGMQARRHPVRAHMVHREADRAL